MLTNEEAKAAVTANRQALEMAAAAMQASGQRAGDAASILFPRNAGLAGGVHTGNVEPGPSAGDEFEALARSSDPRVARSARRELDAIEELEATASPQSYEEPAELPPLDQLDLASRVALAGNTIGAHATDIAREINRLRGVETTQEDFFQ